MKHPEHIERIEPNLRSALFQAHLSRYIFEEAFAGGHVVLDAGCGTGYGAHHFARTAETIIGFDINQEVVARCRGRYRQPNLWHLATDCTAFPFQTPSFDLVCSFEVIEHIADYPAYLVGDVGA
ncbi:MAG: class I SAM-dependent methyltransferase [bacterium]|nr:class I SAM-dependent methyltransferase [bacterium]